MCRSVGLARGAPGPMGQVWIGRQAGRVEHAWGAGVGRFSGERLGQGFGLLGRWEYQVTQAGNWGGTGMEDTGSAGLGQGGEAQAAASGRGGSSEQEAGMRSRSGGARLSLEHPLPLCAHSLLWPLNRQERGDLLQKNDVFQGPTEMGSNYHLVAVGVSEGSHPI